ncbi:hypothetical protein SAMN04487948_12224 [Halogranum amylolyticum]|uniref:Uncharacterized protein n=1 Tax=Halogranum amylolyticum TaxID=660520 RepID=A0A1H8W1Q4_9EURY|nr:hypothetical protein [Halogranum amylolyticum]SEP21576.1 hypothetical protein SAMN04487948_12224 [Halogranum amylolyticum]
MPADSSEPSEELVRRVVRDELSDAVHHLQVTIFGGFALFTGIHALLGGFSAGGVGVAVGVVGAAVLVRQFRLPAPGEPGDDLN